MLYTLEELLEAEYKVALFIRSKKEEISKINSDIEVAEWALVAIRGLKKTAAKGEE